MMDLKLEMKGKSKIMKKRRKGPSPYIVHDAQRLYNQLFEIEKKAKHSAAPNPVSLEKYHLKNLHSTHLVGEKNDGVRCLLLLGRTDDIQEQNYLVQVFRNRNIQEVDCVMDESNVDVIIGPHEAQSVCLYDGTLLDGEFVEATNELVLFDIIAAGGFDTKAFRLPVRQSTLKDVASKLPKMPFHVRCKEFVSVSKAAQIYESSANSDGLIFMAIDDPVRTGRCDRMYKWKTLEQSTLDLQYDGEQFFAIGDGGRKETDIPFPTPTGSFVKGAIYELAPCFDRNSPWKIVRMRKDKVVPNHLVTIRRTLQSIQDNISIDDILLR